MEDKTKPKSFVNDEIKFHWNKKIFSLVFSFEVLHQILQVTQTIFHKVFFTFFSSIRKTKNGEEKGDRKNLNYVNYGIR